MGKLKLYILSGALFLLAFSVVFAITELVLRYTALTNSAEARDFAVQAPYMPAKLKGDYRGVIWGVPFSTDQHGFRDEEKISPKPAEDEYRILSLGDSIGFGVGIKASAHYTKVLERNLNQRTDSGRVRVINAGGQGDSPSAYYVYLRNEGIHFKPRLVIVEIELCNDVTDEALLNWEPEAESGGLPVAVRGGRYIVAWDGNFLATCSMGPYFFEKTYTYTVLLRRLLNLLYWLHPTEPFRSQSRKGVTYYSLGFDRVLLNESRIESGWEKMLRALKGTHEYLGERGVSFLLLIMPSRFVFEKASRPYGDFARNLVARAANLLQQKQIPYIDVTNSIAEAGGAKLYFDFAHLTEEGNEAVGKTLLDYLTDEDGLMTLVTRPRAEAYDAKGRSKESRNED